MSNPETPRLVRRPARSGFGVAWLIVCLFGAAAVLAMARDAREAGLHPPDPVLYVPAASAVERIGLSFDALLADVYWIRAIQHYGGTRLSEAGDRRYPLLHPLLDIATTLDPHFAIAYRFGAMFLAEPPPGGPGRADQAIALLHKGLRAEPRKWQYMQDLGFVYYWWLHDYRQAASWFERAGEIPGAPWFLQSLAAVTLTEGGDRARSRLLWQQMRDMSDNDWLRSNAELRLAQLDALDEIDGLQARVREFEAGASRAADSWTAVIRAGLLRAIPIDPAGTPYLLDPADGTVTVSPESRLFPLPSEPRARPTGSPDA